MGKKETKKNNARPVQGDLVEVTWEDIIHVGEWTPLPAVKALTCPICKDVGFFIAKDSKYLRISNSVCIDGDMSVCVFPIGVIKSIKIVKRA